MLPTTELIRRHTLAMRAENCVPHTIQNRESILRRLRAAAGDLTTLDHEHITAWLAGLPVRDSTRAAYFCQIRDFYRWAVRVGAVDRNPCDQLRAPRRPQSHARPVRADHLPHIVTAARGDTERAMILLAALAGLRIHEIAKMRGEDYSAASATFTITGKGGVTSTIAINDDVRRLADEMPRRGWWFPSDLAAAGHVPARSVGRAIKRAITAAGYEYTPHQLRHWYGTTLLRQGVDIRIVQELMRHVSIQSTQIYTEVNEDQQRAGIARLSVAA